MKRPTYTASSFIKKVFRPGERSLPRNEICDRLEESLLEAGVDEASDALLTRVLHMEDSPIRAGRTDAIIELTYQPHQLFDMAYRFVRDTHTPKTVEQIVPELRRQTQFSWNQLARMLQFERDPRFVQYAGDKRWYLSEWKIANEQIYQFAVQNNIHQMAQRSVSYFLENDVGLPLKEYVFLPELDDRFRLEGDTLHIVALVEPDTLKQSAVTHEGAHFQEDEIIEPQMEDLEIEEADMEEADMEEADMEETDMVATNVEAELTLDETHDLFEPADFLERLDDLYESTDMLEPSDTVIVPDMKEPSDVIIEPDMLEPSAVNDELQIDEEDHNRSFQQIAATQHVTEEKVLFTFEEETVMNTTQPQTALTEVQQLLRQALRRLEVRNDEMSQNVILYFQQSNMQAIESLMEEKHKNEQITSGIHQLLASVEQQ